MAEKTIYNQHFAGDDLPTLRSVRACCSIPFLSMSYGGIRQGRRGGLSKMESRSAKKTDIVVDYHRSVSQPIY